MSEQLYRIQVFDDGRSEYKDYPNMWRVTGKKFNGGKLVLQNVSNPEVKIGSISSWKVKIIESNQCLRSTKGAVVKKTPSSSDDGADSPADDYSSDEILIIPENTPRTSFKSEEDIANYLKTPEGKVAYGCSEMRAFPE
jgi:hypothetical protein